MGRKPTKNSGLPPHMRARPQKSGTIYYYYDHGGKPRKETPLGSDYVEAIRKWADLEQTTTPAAGVITFKYAAERYMREVIPQKATRTQQDNLDYLKKLIEFFDNPPAQLDEIEPVHVKQYLDWRNKQAVQAAHQKNEERKHLGRTPIPVDPKTGQVRANREKSLFSHIWNCCREWGYTAKQNPCDGVRGHKERRRSVYVDDESYQAVWQAADEPLRDAMDLAFLTGQRPADVLKMSETDVHNNELWIQQNKTQAKLRITIQGELATVI